MRLLVVYLCVVGMVPCAAAQTAVTTAVQQGRELFYACRLTAAQEVRAGPQTMPATRTCLAHAKETLAPAYQAARAAVHGSTLARLYDWYAAWLSGLDAVLPAPGEGEAAYLARVAAVQLRLGELGYRVEVEGP